MREFKNVAAFADLKPGHPVAVEVDGEKILLIRDGDRISAFAAQCPHAGAPLEEGAVCEGRLICPWHKTVFDISDGTLIEPPSLKRLPRYDSRVVDGDVLVISGQLSDAKGAMDADSRVFVLVGAGAAGAAAAAALRDAGFAGRILMLGSEPRPPYDRTSLSKFVVSGQMPADQIPPLLDDDFFTRHAVELRHGTVSGFNARTKQIELEDGTQVHFDAALIATGGIPRPLQVPGETLDGIHVLRTSENGQAIANEIKAGSRIVILGDSFIGLEVASALRERDLAVTIIAPHAVPFKKQFGEQLGRMFKDLHERNGVAFVTGHAARFEGDACVRAVVLDDGARLDADMVIIGTGVRPATAFISGLDMLDDGSVVVDAGMRAAPDVYAAGDIASFPLSNAGDGVRIEHWRVAQQQARIAAHNMVGQEARYDGVPFFWTYHFGKRFEYLGHAREWDETRIEGDIAQQEFVALLGMQGRLVAVLACQKEKQTAVLVERMRKGLSVDEAVGVVRSTS